MTQDDTPSVKYELPSRFEVVEQMIDEAQNFFGAKVADEEVLYRIVLLACEATTNAVEHGNRLDPSLNVKVRFALSEGRASIEVEDQGSGFNPEQLKDPVASENLFQERGRGVFLINELADAVKWDKGGSRVTIQVNLPAE